MDKYEAVFLLMRSERTVFNAYRQEHPNWIPDFSGEDLEECDLIGDETDGANLDRAILVGTKLPKLDQIQQQREQQQRQQRQHNSADRRLSFKDAIIDSKTTGPSLGWLLKQGAKYITGEQIELQKTVQATRVFISYAWANGQLVSAMEKWLRLKGLDTKIDRRDFFAGARIRDEIMRLMKDSAIVLVFHSIESKDKPWIEFERELVTDLQMSARKEGVIPARVIYVVLDSTPLPSITEDNRISILAKGKRFELVCEEIYHQILRLPRESDEIDLSRWSAYVF